MLKGFANCTTVGKDGDPEELLCPRIDTITDLHFRVSELSSAG